jgi:hypothetical protein
VGATNLYILRPRKLLGTFEQAYFKRRCGGYCPSAIVDLIECASGMRCQFAASVTPQICLICWSPSWRHGWMEVEDNSRNKHESRRELLIDSNEMTLMRVEACTALTQPSINRSAHLRPLSVFFRLNVFRTQAIARQFRCFPTAGARTAEVVAAWTQAPAPLLALAAPPAGAPCAISGTRRARPSRCRRSLL